jgi:hypothetical protein
VMRTEDPASTVHNRTAAASADGRDNGRGDPEGAADGGAARSEGRTGTDEPSPEEEGYGYGV